MTLALVAPVVVAFSPTPVMAAGANVASCFTGLSISVGACVTEFAAWTGNLVLTASSFLIILAGSLLNFSLKLTLDIGRLTNNVKAIENTWVVIRNLSSIFIIFTLLYTSILTILDMGKANIKELVGKVVLAGLLINFSLFFTKAAIDASNLVSLRFYSAIAPEYMTSTDAGLSKIFMGSLKLQNIYHPDNTALAAGAKSEAETFISIAIATYGGAILMLFAAISFFAAAVAFAIRTAVLILLMAFSPVYFVGMIFPELKKDVADEWLNMLTGQLIFMPVYLLLMYVAMTIITDTNFMSFITSSKPVPTVGSMSFIYRQVGIVIQYFIAILFINAPLIAAVKLGAMGTKFTEGMVKGLQDKILQQPGALAQNSVGRMAKFAQDGLRSSRFASSNPVSSHMMNSVLGGVAKAEMGGGKGGYVKRFEDYSKSRTEFGKKLKSPKDMIEEEYGKRVKKYDSETTALLVDQATIEGQLSEARTTAAAYGEGSDNRKKFENEAADLERELEDKKREIESRKKNRKDNLEKEKKASEKINSLKYAENLADSPDRGIFKKAVTFSWLTSKGRKDAADAIKKDVNKGKDQRLLDAIKEVAENDKPKGGDKPEGGEKPKNK